MAKVLFVDDEQMILNSLKRGLRKLDEDFYFAMSGREALQIIKHTDIDVVFSDMKMPEMSGLELLKEVEAINPDIVKVIVSGYAQLPQLIATINQTEIYKYIAKPFDLYMELVPVIKDAIEYAEYKKMSRLRKDMLESKNEAYRNILKTMKAKTNSQGQGFDLIRIYQQVIFNNMKDLIQEEGLPVKKKLDAISSHKRFAEHYLNEVKKNEIYYEPNRIISEVAYVLKRDGYKIVIEKGIHESSKMLYEGRGSHIKPIIVSLIQDLIKPETVGTLQIVSTELNRSEELSEVNFVVEGKTRLFNITDDTNHNVKLYQALLKIFGGSLEIVKDDDKVDLILTAMLHLSQEGEDDEFFNS